MTEHEVGPLQVKQPTESQARAAQGLCLQMLAGTNVWCKLPADHFPAPHLFNSTRPQALPKQAAPLVQWWKETAEADVGALAAKMDEYGGRSNVALDLVQVGQSLEQIRVTGQPVTPNDSVEELTELGLFFYLKSKLARWEAAIHDGRRPSDDTLYDLSVYAMMARRNRHAGAWPGRRK